MYPNPLANIIAALSTLVIGFIYYHPKVLGNIWMKAEGLTLEQLKNSNMIKTYGFTIFFSFLLAFAVVPGIVMHQFGATQLAGGNASDPALIEFLAVHGKSFLSFKHGALHGTFTGLLLIFPIFAINGLFNQKSWKSIFIASGYWIICLAVMGALICGWQ